MFQPDPRDGSHGNVAGKLAMPSLAFMEHINTPWIHVLPTGALTERFYHFHKCQLNTTAVCVFFFLVWFCRPQSVFYFLFFPLIACVLWSSWRAWSATHGAI